MSGTGHRGPWVGGAPKLSSQTPLIVGSEIPRIGWGLSGALTDASWFSEARHPVPSTRSAFCQPPSPRGKQTSAPFPKCMTSVRLLSPPRRHVVHGGGQAAWVMAQLYFLLAHTPGLQFLTLKCDTKVPQDELP